MATALYSTDFSSLGPRHQGKVRDIYDLGDKLLLVATDRISAFDVVMDEPIPYKGVILTKLSLFWLGYLRDVVPNHLLTANPHEYPVVCRPYIGNLNGRSMLVKKCEVLPVECIVRGFLSGSGWKDYKKTGAVSGITLPPGLVESQQLAKPIFTPSTKAKQGMHDENISFTAMCHLVGRNLAERVREISLKLYALALDYARPRGIILADTKFEFGLTPKGELLLIDEVLTPDSSRFWPADKYRAGGPQKSYDKQYLRDYLESLGWNKKPPPPLLPSDVIDKTYLKYSQALRSLTSLETN